MSKPIEPGCKAKLVNCNNPINNEKIVTIGDFIGEVEGWRGNDRWGVDITVFDAFSSKTCNHAREEHLERIDEYDGNEKITWEDMKGIWQPKKIAALFSPT